MLQHECKDVAWWVLSGCTWIHLENITVAPFQRILLMMPKPKSSIREARLSPVFMLPGVNFIRPTRCIDFWCHGPQWKPHFGSEHLWSGICDHAAHISPITREIFELLIAPEMVSFSRWQLCHVEVNCSFINQYKLWATTADYKNAALNSFMHTNVPFCCLLLVSCRCLWVCETSQEN